MTLLDQKAPVTAVGAIRTVVFGLWFIKTALDPLQSVASLPISLFEPVGFLALVPVAARPVLVEVGFLYGLKVAELIALGLVLVGVGGTLSAVGACVLLTLAQGIIRGFSGHVHHSDLVLLYAAYLLALWPIADNMVRRQRRAAGTNPAPDSGRVLVAAILATLCLTYTLTGTYRFLHGGVETFRSGSATFWALRNSYQLVHPAWGFGKLLLEFPLLSHALNATFPIVTAFEAAGIAALLVRPFRWVFLAVMIGMHLMSWLFLEVFFWENLILFAFFLDRPGRMLAGHHHRFRDEPPGQRG